MLNGLYPVPLFERCVNWDVPLFSIGNLAAGDAGVGIVIDLDQSPLGPGVGGELLGLDGEAGLGFRCSSRYF